MDGDEGLGLVVAPFAMSLAIKKSKNVGSGWIAVRNSNHFGIAAQHALMALEEDMIGIVMTNASALVAPTFSIERLLGTNPICVAIPAGKEPPFVADLGHDYGGQWQTGDPSKEKSGSSSGLDPG